MNTLLLRLVGPMLSWGEQSRYSVRDTGLEPSKSGVVGLLYAAMGRRRDRPVEDLAAMIMGVRADREGYLSRDYHVAGTGGYLKAGGAIERKNVILSSRYYLADAAFLVGFESDELDLLQRLQEALYHPVWALFLGRKSFVPAEPIVLEDGLSMNTPMLEVLQSYRFLGRGDAPERVRGVIEDPTGDQVRMDQPVSFRMGDRQFVPRRVRTIFFASPPSSVIEQSPGEVS